MGERRLAVVTGGGTGIGRAVVERLAAIGLRVLAVGRDERALAAVAEQAPGRGWQIATATCDVTDDAAVDALFGDTGPVDVLVANAGTAQSAPLQRTSLEDWNRHLAVNATGVFLCLRAVVPDMRTRNRGRVVVIASTAGLRGGRYISAYTASKHAAVGLVRASAAEVAGSNVTVNAVCPGYVRTAMTERSVQRIMATTGRDREQALVSLTGSSGRLIEPSEVAGAVAYLCGEEAAAINGQTLVIDGGGPPR
jgi:NAD(P)-dependent dehydrogenase (short-subunit alcohol dehydrogenase family)